MDSDAPRIFAWIGEEGKGQARAIHAAAVQDPDAVGVELDRTRDASTDRRARDQRAVDQCDLGRGQCDRAAVATLYRGREDARQVQAAAGSVQDGIQDPEQIEVLSALVVEKNRIVCSDSDRSGATS